MPAECSIDHFEFGDRVAGYVALQKREVVEGVSSEVALSRAIPDPMAKEGHKVL